MNTTTTQTPAEEDEVWVTKDGRRIPCAELEADHARAIVRMVVKQRRTQARSLVGLAALVKRMIQHADAREADMLARFEEDLMNDVYEDRKWGSD